MVYRLLTVTHVVTTTVGVACATAAVGATRTPSHQTGAESVSVSLTVPAPPVPARAAGQVTLAYELHVANTGSGLLRIVRIDIRSGDGAGASSIATLGTPELARDVKLIAPRGAPVPKALSPGVRAVAYLWLTFDSLPSVPTVLSHRVTFADGTAVDGAPVSVRSPTPIVLAPPVGAGDWWIGLGPSNTSEHRRAVIRVGDDTVPHLAQRFAIDWVKVDSGGEYARDHRGRRNTDWYGYGEPVFAVADARVAAALDSIPDNTPGEDSRAVPMRVATVLGNYVLLDLGPDADGTHTYALYGHLTSGSVRVHTGEVVARGAVLGMIGNSGNSDGPHLHFHLTEAPDAATAPLRGEGVPFVLDSFAVVAHDPERVARHARLTPLGDHRGEMPVEGDVVRLTKRP